MGFPIVDGLELTLGNEVVVIKDGELELKSSAPESAFAYLLHETGQYGLYADKLSAAYNSFGIQVETDPGELPPPPEVIEPIITDDEPSDLPPAPVVEDVAEIAITEEVEVIGDTPKKTSKKK